MQGQCYKFHVRNSAPFFGKHSRTLGTNLANLVQRKQRLPVRPRDRAYIQANLQTNSVAKMVVLSFTPVEGLLGGLALGIAAGATVLLNGRIMGLSGIARRTIKGDFKSGRLAFLGGLFAGAALLSLLFPSAFDTFPATFTLQRAVMAGILVGTGSSMGNGCTSGHGICGLSRMSKRSLVYTLTFMVCGALAATLSGTVPALGIAAKPAQLSLPDPATLRAGLALVIGSAATMAVLGWQGVRAQGPRKNTLSTAVDAVAGLVFALGVGLAGMTRPTKVAAFLDMTAPSWDLSLIFVMGGAILLAFPAFQYVMRSLQRSGKKPACAADFELPKGDAIDVKLLLGAVLFGAGWGLGGVCPGPAIVALIRPSEQLIGWALGFATGVFIDSVVSPALF